MSDEKDELRKAQCSVCSGLRNCDILGHHPESGSDSFTSWNQDWFILKCRGCDHVFCQTSSSNSEDYDYSHDEYGEEQIVHDEVIHYWPALLKRPSPLWLANFNAMGADRGALNDALSELYGALENDLNTLAAIGIRTCFDIASEMLGADANLTFAKKLDALVASGHIGVVDRDRLETLVEAGSASAHRGWKPTQDDISVMADLLEHFIHKAFVGPEESKKLDMKVAALKPKVPKRRLAQKNAQQKITKV